MCIILLKERYRTECDRSKNLNLFMRAGVNLLSLQIANSQTLLLARTLLMSHLLRAIVLLFYFHTSQAAPSWQGKTNVTKVDCGIRQLAFGFAKSLNDDEEILMEVHDALRLSDLCHVEKVSKTFGEPTTLLDKRRKAKELEMCTSMAPCVYVEAVSSAKKKLRSAQDGSLSRPWMSIHDALVHARKLLNRKNTFPTIILREGIHSLEAKPLKLRSQDSGLKIMGYPGENAWISGGLPLENVEFKETGDDGLLVADLTELLSNYDLPKMVSLFTTTRRYIRARFPNSDPELDQWGYASPHRLNYSLRADLVVEWHRPHPTTPPEFTFFDFDNFPPDGVPRKNNSKQEGYNWYASGHGGACSDIWGEGADSYWCSNASQGGWAEVDRESAMTGQMQLPIGMTYNSSVLKNLQDDNLLGGILHAWHSQSWAMHMFEITNQSTGELTFAKGGGRQGGRNWCRCDQCPYAGYWCGQKQNPSWKDTRLISGTWMIENVKDELDQPGEYFFDPKEKLLYLKPNITFDSNDFHIGILEQLIAIQNVGNITIENLGFRDMASTYMSDDWSPPSGGDWSLHRGGAIFLEDTSDIAIRNCHFRRIDGNAVFLSRRNRNVTIEDSLFEWIGENAIATWGDTAGYDATAGNFPMYTLIQNNVMREIGIYQKQSSAVGQCKTALTTIRNNIMFNLARAAINFNDMVGGGDIVEGNLIFNTCRESGDHGPINSWDRQAFLTTLRDGTTKSFDPIPRQIKHNFIFANYGASQGVDNDDGSSWFHIHNNFFYQADGFKMDYGGHDSVFEDNLVIAFPYRKSQCFGMGSFFEGHGDILRRNRCLLGLGNSPGSNEWDDPYDEAPLPGEKEPEHNVGSFGGECEHSPLTLASNEYYTPDGEANVSCGSGTYSLNDLQEKFGLEEGSTNALLPDDETILQWAEDKIDLGRLPRVQ